MKTIFCDIDGTLCKHHEDIVKQHSQELELLPDNVREEVKAKEVIFQPNEGPQTDFLAAPETDVLYGGAAGGGKSYAMLVDPLRFAHRAAHRALILRRSMPERRA